MFIQLATSCLLPALVYSALCHLLTGRASVTTCAPSPLHFIVTSRPQFIHAAPLITTPSPFAATMITLTYFDFLCNLTVLLIILFTALSYATGLFYIAELAEEFPTFTKRFIRYIVVAIAALHTLAFFSSLPRLPLVIGLFAHLSYLPLLTTFPVLPLSSPIFYLSLVLLLASQVGWYYKMPTSPYPSYPTYGSYNTSVRSYSTAQLLAFYLLFVWLVPLVFFVAGSVTSQSLPMDGERVRGEEDERKGGRWSIAGIGRWWKREKGSGGRERKEDESNTAEPQPSSRYEPNPAYYGNGASSSLPTSSASYSAYQPAPHQPANNGMGAPSWYAQQLSSYPSTSSEGEWMGQRSAPPQQMAVRQRSHAS